jgi:parallel beta-helix repeat protein
MKKVASLFISLMLILGFLVIVDLVLNFTPMVGGNTLYVNETGDGGAFTSIQDAINAAVDGDTIYVYNGTYFENILVNKTINLTGMGQEVTVIDGGWSDGVLRVTSDWVNITGLTITNGYYAVRLESSNNTVSGNKISGNGDDSLYLELSSNNRVMTHYIWNYHQTTEFHTTSLPTIEGEFTLTNHPITSYLTIIFQTMITTGYLLDRLQTSV